MIPMSVRDKECLQLRDLIARQNERVLRPFTSIYQVVMPCDGQYLRRGKVMPCGACRAAAEDLDLHLKLSAKKRIYCYDYSSSSGV